MKNYEPSTSTRGLSSSGVNEVKENLTDGATTFLDKLFPLFNFLSQNIQLPSLLSHVFTLFFWAQSLVMNLFLVVKASTTTPYAYIEGYLARIFLLQMGSDISSCLLPTIVLGVLFAIIVVAVIFLLSYYNSAKRFVTWPMYPLRIILEYGSMVAVPFAVSLTVTAFQNAYSEKLRVMYIILGCCLYAFFLFSFSVAQNLYAYSPYLTGCPLQSFDPAPMLYYFIFNTLFYLLAGVCATYPDFIHIILYLAHMLLMGYLFNEFMHYPMINSVLNKAFMSLTVFGVVADIANIATSAANISRSIYYYTLIAGLVCAFAVPAVLMHLRTKRLLKELDEDFEEGEEDDYMKTERQLMDYLRVGFRANSDTFLSLVLFRKSINIFSYTEYYAQCLRLVSFFPMESQLMNMYYTRLATFRDMPIGHRFLIYQLHRLKILRQAGTSSKAAERLLFIKDKSKECELAIRNFWKAKEFDIGDVYSLSKSVEYTSAEWEEALQDYPNSATHFEAYSQFLIECKADFSNAVRKKNFADILEAGNGYKVDKCFKLFVRNFPQYLKKKKLTLKGRIIKPSSAKGSAYDHISSTEDDELDIALEESIARTLFTSTKMRLALQNVADTRKSNNNGTIIGVSIFLVLLGFGILIPLFVYLNSIFSTSETSLAASPIVQRVRVYFFKAFIGCMLKWSQAVGTNSVIAGLSNPEFVADQTLDYFGFASGNYDSFAMKQLATMRAQYNSYISVLADIAYEGKDPYKIGANMLTDNCTAFYCSSTMVYAPLSTTLKVISVQYMTSIAAYLMKASYGTTLSDEDFGFMLTNCVYYPDQMEQLYNTMQLSYEDDHTYIERITSIMLYALIAGYFVLSAASFAIFNFLFKKEVKQFLEFLHETEDKAKQEAAQEIKKFKTDDEERGDITTLSSKKSYYSTFLEILIYLLILLVSGGFFALIYYTRMSNEQYLNMSHWHKYANDRMAYVTEALAFLTMGILIDTTVVPYNNRTSLLAMAQKSMSTLAAYHNVILSGSGSVIAMYGYNSQLDSYNFLPDTNGNCGTSFHDLYACSSLTQQIGIATNLLDQIVDDIASYGGNLQGDDLMQFLHLMSEHILVKLYAAGKLQLTLGDTIKASFTSSITIFFVVLLVLVILLGVVLSFQVRYLRSCYSMIMVLMKRLPPISIISNSKLINYLLNTNTTKAQETSIASKSIIQHSQDAVICLNSSFLIELVNKSVTDTFGYTPEQLLGQPISIILSEDDKTSFMNHLDLMHSGQVASLYEGKIMCITDSNNNIPCRVEVIVRRSSTTHENQFIILLEDQTELTRQEQEVEIAKKKSEDLLFQILPRDIVIRLNQQETEISFTVPSASIMFIDIVKFSEYSVTLTPQQIMGNLSDLFARFDLLIAKYPLLTKIKLIGDVYMAAGGLFTPKNPPQEHAAQIIQFGLDALKELDEFNASLDSNLSVRIGVNSGGPLIAGVLGTDQPVFDIIGDPINIASRLQSTSIPGKIQISEATYELIKDKEFRIEHRGEVFLKGKGKTQAYFVLPENLSIFQLSNSLRDSSLSGSVSK